MHIMDFLSTTQVLCRNKEICTSPALLRFFGFDPNADKVYFQRRREHLQTLEEATLEEVRQRSTCICLVVPNFVNNTRSGKAFAQGCNCGLKQHTLSPCVLLHGPRRNIDTVAPKYSHFCKPPITFDH